MIIITSFSIILVFFLACVTSFFKIISHNYIQYSCYRTVVTILQGFLNRWIISILLTTFVISLFYLFIILTKKLIKNILGPRFLKINFKNRRKRIILAFLLFTLTFITVLRTGGLITWVTQNVYRISKSLHPLNFMISTGIFFSITLFLSGLFLLKLKKYNLFTKLAQKKYIRNLSVSLIIFIISLNLFIFLDKKINSPPGPNIILIEVDTLRADHVSCYGYKRETTPYIDKFSQDSILYKNCISTSPWTTPSVGSIFTAHYPSVLGYKGTPIRLKREFLTLSEILRNKNYFTKGIISNPFISTSLNLFQGFDSYDENSIKGGSGITSPSITQKGISFIKKHRNDKFFLFLFYYDPHHDFILHKNYNYYPDYKGKVVSNESILKLRELIPELTSKDKKYLKALYDSEISFTDKHIGHFLEALKKLDLYHNSLIIFTADHGEEFAERKNPWLGHSRKLYQEQIRVPLLIKLPGQKNRQVISQNVSQIGLMSTILRKVGLKVPKRYPHSNRKIPLTGSSSKKYVISETKRDNKLKSVIWGDWKYIYDLSDGSKELYNLKKDPGELHNMANKNKNILKKLENFIKKWKSNTKSMKRNFTTGKKTKSPNFSKQQVEKLKSLGYME